MTSEQHLRVAYLRYGIKALTARELDVVMGIVAGLTVGETAKRLNIGDRTVKTYRQRAMHKLMVHSAVDLVLLIADAALIGALPCSALFAEGDDSPIQTAISEAAFGH